MKYKHNDWVKFYPNVITNQIFYGKIVGIVENTHQYLIMYEGSRFCVHEQFIIDEGKFDMNDIKGWGIVDFVKIQRMMDLNEKLTNQLEKELEYVNRLENDYNDMREELLVTHGALIASHKIINELRKELDNMKNRKGICYCGSPHMEH